MMEDNLFFLVERVFCWAFLIVGLSLICQTPLWTRLVKKWHSQESHIQDMLLLASGVFLLPVAIALVLVHNDWFLSFSLIATVVVWLLLVKSLFMVFWPQILRKYCTCLYGKKESFLKWYFRGYGLGLVVLAFALCYGLSESVPY